MVVARVVRILPPVGAAAVRRLSRPATAAAVCSPALRLARSFHNQPMRRAEGPTPPAGAAAATESTAIEGSAIPEAPASDDPTIDWSSSFHGLSTAPVSAEAANILLTPVDPDDVEIKPDGIIYLPEIKYRRILHRAFGPGGWGLAPRSELAVGEKVVTREYALVVQGRFVGQARGECPYFGEDGVATAGEGCKSNALMRCCKDLGIASELWDPRFIRKFKKDYAREVWVEHVVTKKRRQIWLRKDCGPAYPYQLTTTGSASASTSSTSTAAKPAVKPAVKPYVRK